MKRILTGLSRRSAGIAVVAAVLAIGTAAYADTDPAVVATAKAATAKNSVAPNAWHGPTISPPAAKGKKVTIISCLQASDCSIDAAGTAEAAKAIGWEPTIVDGKGDIAVYNASIRTAVNSGADGIINIALPVPLIQDGLRYAKDKKIPVVSSANVISPDPLLYSNNEHQWVLQGNMLADWMIADSNGTAGGDDADLGRLGRGRSDEPCLQRPGAGEGECPDLSHDRRGVHRRWSRRADSVVRFSRRLFETVGCREIIVVSPCRRSKARALPPRC